MIEQKVIETFLNGSDPEKYIVGVEYNYQKNVIIKVIQDPEMGKIFREDTFIPFLWVSDLTELNFYKKNKEEQRRKMKLHGITIKKLRTDGNDRLEKGMKYLVKTTKRYNDLINFFKDGGLDPWSDKHKPFFIVLTPVEQYLVQKKKRLFKGLEEYSDVHRLVFDIETTGLNPEKDKIILIGLKDNRGYKEVIDTFGVDGEKRCITEFFYLLSLVKPTVIGGYNSAFFDFPFIIKRAEILGLDIKELTRFVGDNDFVYSPGIKMKDGMLKLANEVEKYNQYVMFGYNIVDIAHGVRRAQAINSDIKSWGLKYITKFIDKEKVNRVYVKGDKISNIYLSDKSFYLNPKTGNYKEIGASGTENLLTKFPGRFEVWSGKRIVEQYLDDDLYETMVVDDSFSQSTFLLSKLVPTTYERVSTMGTATLWKLIMLAWSYEHDLAIPEKMEKTKFTGGLSRLLRVGYAVDVVKFDYSSLYPSIQLVYDIFPECDIMGVQKSLLKYFRDMRIMYKHLASEFKDTDTEKSESYDRKQLPIKIFINAYFGSLSAPHVFPWGDMLKGEAITCIGRQSLRMMNMWFMKKNYIPLVMDTDGVNFSSPKDVSDRVYVGLGKNELVIKDKVYTGVEADVAEFNDIFMRGEMGLDIDYVAPSCVNVSRKNYIIKMIKKGKEKIKLTGNTIKSKKLQQYIVEFLDEGFIHLLSGNGHLFVESYYDYVSKIINKEIPLSKIANKARVKQTIEEYGKYIKKVTKSGSLMARQAHMELIVLNNYNPGLGETIYYVNNGTKKSSGDVQKISKPTKRQKAEYLEKHGVEMPINYIEVNCYMIPESDITDYPDKTGEYNVERYLSVFNKRIEPLLVVFKPEIRSQILVSDLENRPYFTKQQCEMINGIPFKEKDQDSFDEVMTLSESEVKFWKRTGLDPYMMYLEDSLSHVDQKWVENNRKILEEETRWSVDNEEEFIDYNDEELFGLMEF